MKKKEEKSEERKYKFRNKRPKEVIHYQDKERQCLVVRMSKKWMMKND